MQNYSNFPGQENRYENCVENLVTSGLCKRWVAFLLQLGIEILVGCGPTCRQACHKTGRYA